MEKHMTKNLQLPLMHSFVSMRDTETNRHTSVTTEGSSENKQSKSFIRNNPIFAKKLRQPQVSTLCSGYSLPLSRKKKLGPTLSKWPISLIKQPRSSVTKSSENVFRWCALRWNSALLYIWRFQHWTISCLFLSQMSRVSSFYILKSRI